MTPISLAPRDSIMTVHPDRLTGNPEHGVVVQLENTLRAPIDGGLRPTLAALVRRGERVLILDLERLDAIDAAGVGELIGAFSEANAAGSALGIARPRRRVRRLLQVAGVLGILSGCPSVPAVAAMRSECPQLSRCLIGSSGVSFGSVGFCWCF